MFIFIIKRVIEDAQLLLGSPALPALLSVVILTAMVGEAVHALWRGEVRVEA